MTQLVTGATGLIGGHLIQRLAAEGEQVRALVRPGSRVAELQQLGVELAVGDLCDADSVHRAMRGVSVVYHCGGLVSDWGKRSDFFSINAEGTRHVVDAGLSAGIDRLVYLSSASVYGYRGTGHQGNRAVSESEPFLSRRIPYIESKIAAERILQQAIDDRKLDAVVLRPVMVFGPKCQNYVGEIVRHLRKGTMVLLDGGRHIAGLAYVENVADACLLAGRIGHASGGIFNICDGSPITWKQYFDALAEGIGVRSPSRSMPTWLAYRLAIGMETVGRMVNLRNRPLLTRLAVLELGQAQSYDISAARRDLGYEPRVDFQSAMQNTLEWVKESL